MMGSVYVTITSAVDLLVWKVYVCSYIQVARQIICTGLSDWAILSNLNLILGQKCIMV